MAIKITQEATTPNMANSDLLFVLTSSYSTSSQFQYVCDIQDDNNNIIQRMKQQPNPQGYAVFNIGQMLLTQLESDEVWKSSIITAATSSLKDFKIAFGEEYGTSSFSNVDIFDGKQNVITGSPALSGSEYYSIENGLVEQDSGEWNWDSSSYYTEFTTPNAGTAQYQHGLSYSPKTLYIKPNDYHTIALLNGNLNGTLNPNEAHDVYVMDVKVYDDENATGNLLTTLEVYNDTAEGGGPRVLAGNPFGTYVNQQSNQTRLQYWGVGPQNINDYSSSFLPTDWKSYKVEWYTQDLTASPNPNFILDSYTFNKQEGNCDYDRVRFAWKNEFGTWDYYNFTLAQNSATDIERINYRKTFVDYSTTQTSVPYNISRRGKKNLVNKLDEVKTANTDWLTQGDADWLQEVFYSNNVYIQDGSDFKPVMIQNNNIITKTNPRTQKIFQYQITYKLANPKRQRQ